jgi:hypothetical protein
MSGFWPSGNEREREKGGDHTLLLLGIAVDQDEYTMTQVVFNIPTHILTISISILSHPIPVISTDYAAASPAAWERTGTPRQSAVPRVLWTRTDPSKRTEEDLCRAHSIILDAIIEDRRTRISAVRRRRDGDGGEGADERGGGDLRIVAASGVRVRGRKIVAAANRSVSSEWPERRLKRSGTDCATFLWRCSRGKP